MKTKGGRCSQALLLLVFTFTLGTFLGFSQPQQNPSPLADRAVEVSPQPFVQAVPIPSAATMIAHVEVGRSGRQVIVRVEGNGRLNCQTERLSNPERLVLDCSGAHLALAQSAIPSALKPVRRVRLGQFRPDITRVVIDLEHAAPFSLRSEGNTIAVAFSADEAPESDSAAAQMGTEQGKKALRSNPTQAVRLPSAPRGTTGSSGTPRLEPLTQGKPSLATPVTPAAKVEAFENALDHGMLTFRAQNQTLRSILQQIAQKADVAIVLAEGVGEEKLSVEFQHYRLDEALRQILKGYDAFFFYGAHDEKVPASLKAVWVYPASRGRGLKPVPPDAWAKSTQEIDALVRRRGRQSADAVQEALRDADEIVRTGALHRALHSGVQIPQELLIDLALNDRSMNVRLLALRALSGDPKLRWVAERALHDPSPSVSEMAQEILSELDAANAPAAPPAANQARPPDQ